MDPERKKTISEFLEARRIDFFGRKSAIANLEPEFIEKLVAVRQIELAASQCVSMWLDLDMAGAEMFEFARISLLEPLAEYVAYGGRSRIGVDIEASHKGHNDDFFWPLWNVIRFNVDLLLNAEVHQADFGSSVMNLLFSAMILRQRIESEWLHANAQKATIAFDMQSTNCACLFLEAASKKLGRVPYGAQAGASLKKLCDRLITETAKSFDSKTLAQHPL